MNTRTLAGIAAPPTNSKWIGLPVTWVAVLQQWYQLGWRSAFWGIARLGAVAIAANPPGPRPAAGELRPTQREASMTFRLFCTQLGKSAPMLISRTPSICSSRLRRSATTLSCPHLPSGR